MVLVLGACTTSDDAEPATTSTAPPATTVAIPAPTTVTTADAVEVDVDIGVDLEADVISVGVVGAVPPVELAGLEAYWALNTVGDRFGVVVEVVDGPDAPVLAVALDATPLPVAALDVLAMAPVQSIDAVAAGRLLDLARPTLGQMIGAVDLALELDDVAGAPGPFQVEAGPTCPFDPMTFQLEGEGDAATLFVCGEPSFAQTVLADLPDAVSTVFLANEAWAPAVAFPEGVEVLVLGAPLPGSDDAPALDVMAALGGDSIADPAWVRGYTAALSMHAVLEAALAAGDMTRAGVLAAAEGITSGDLGLGEAGGEVTVAVPDPTSAGGLRLVGVVAP